jgi:hypothetical protein
LKLNPEFSGLILRGPRPAGVQPSWWSARFIHTLPT